MKLRIKNDSLRLRLSQGEVNALASGEAVTGRTRFSPVDHFSYEIKPWHLAVVESKFESGMITIFVPEEMIAQWASTDEVSIKTIQENGAEGGLHILIEKDFACLAEREGEDESDNFPHPKSGEMKC